MPSVFQKVKFTATSAGTVAFTPSAAVAGYILPGAAGAIVGNTYEYYATVGADFETGSGVWNGTSLSRVTIDSNSAGNTSVLNFANPPVVTVFPANLPLELPAAPTIPAVPGLLYGLTLSTPGLSVNFSVAAGQATDSTNAVQMTLAGSTTKSTSAFAAGSGNGALDTGTIAANGWYHVHLINGTAGTDILISLSATAPTLPAGYSVFRRIGSMRVDGSNHWRAFHQVDDEFLWDVPTNDLNNGNPVTGLPFTVNTPVGVVCVAHVEFLWQTATFGTFVLIHSQLTTAQVVNTPTANISAYNMGATGSTSDAITRLDLLTDTAAGLRAVSSATGGLYATTIGWKDFRGRS